MSTSRGRQALGWLAALAALLAIVVLGTEIGPPVAGETVPACRACP
ncbi:hypothetical protein [Marichromatium purpuratum]|nr:hypothetical protein [Marichromatium purpuratum]